MTIDPAVVIAAIATLASSIGLIARLVYNDLRKDRDFWRDAFLKSVATTDKALRVTEKRVRGG